jgi:hypothetical protein
MTETRWKESVCRAVAIQMIPDKKLAAMPASVGREHLPGEDGESEVATEIELIRSTESEKGQ